jgi:hypothetical protein
MNKNTENIAIIRTKIMKLEMQLNNYCLHKDTSLNGYSEYYGGEIYICKNCGRLFVHQNIDDLINEDKTTELN